MKLVINKCYGGFSLSPKAIKRYAELNNVPCYLFSYDYKTKKHVLIDEEKANEIGFWVAYKIENPDLYIAIDPVLKSQQPENLTGDELISWEENRKAVAEKQDKNREILNSALIVPGNNRTDLTLIQTVEELGLEASGSGSNLVVIEIPDNIDWIIENNSGLEHVAEKHRTWH